MHSVDRRGFLQRALAACSTALLGGCDALSRSDRFSRVLASAEHLTRATQGLLTPRDALAPEYPESMISPEFRPNGSTNPQSSEYRALVAENFGSYRLAVDGMVERPLSLALAEIRALPSRTQITRHDCVEGWSVIGKWKGARLQDVLDRASVAPGAKFVVFHCADELSGSRYYESIDLEDAAHPQTLLAYELNDRSLPVSNGAPLRMRIERQLGYKMAKYVMRIELVASLAGIEGGNGSYWADRGYEWYAGI